MKEYSLQILKKDIKNLIEKSLHLANDNYKVHLQTEIGSINFYVNSKSELRRIKKRFDYGLLSKELILQQPTLVSIPQSIYSENIFNFLQRKKNSNIKKIGNIIINFDPNEPDNIFRMNGSYQVKCVLEESIDRFPGTLLIILEKINLIICIFDPHHPLYSHVCIRTARNLLLKNFLKNNGKFIHGAVLSYNGKGIILVGNKFAGKTTMMLKFLEIGFDFVTNDKSILLIENIKDSNLICYGVPFAVGIWEDIFKLYPKLNKLSNVDQAMSKNTRMSKTNLVKRYFISPSTITKIFSSKYVQSVSLNYIINLDFDKQWEGNPQLLPESSEKIMELLYTSLNPNSGYWEQNKKYEIRAEKKNDIYVKSIVKLPSYKLKFGIKNIANDFNFIKQLLK